uniref:Transposase n=1 Tax=Globodera pallida TaxID=36090 RepID=A0A183BV64_GLOPA
MQKHPVNWDRLASLEPKGILDAQAQRERLASKGRKDRPDPLARRAQLVSQEKPDSPPRSPEESEISRFFKTL